MSYVRHAFHIVTQECDDAERFVTLYQTEQLYGGPEEGGWWRTVISMVSTMKYPTEDEASRAFCRISEKAKEMNQMDRRLYGERCQRDCEWCESRGLEVAWLGEPDGPTQYFVAIERVAGEQSRADSSKYE